MNDILEQEIIQAGEHGIAAYSEFRAQLATLKAENAALVFDYADPGGNKAARSHIHQLRRTKGAVEAARKTEKQASLDYGRRVDSEAKEIIGQIESMIDVHERPIMEIEEREEARKQAILNRLGQICAFLELPPTLPLTELRTAHADLLALSVDESLEESMATGIRYKTHATAYLEHLIADAERREAEAVELERLRAEKAERDREEREAKIAAEAAEKARKEAEGKAELARQKAERKAKTDRDAAAAREYIQVERAWRAEEEAKAAKERAAKAAQEAVERERREAAAKVKAEADAAVKREKDKKHKEAVEYAAVEALCEHAGLNLDQASATVEAIARRQIPAITIAY